MKLYVILGNADIGDNHQETWVAGVYTDREEAEREAAAHTGRAEQEQSAFGLWCKCRHSLPDATIRQSENRSSPEVRAAFEQECLEKCGPEPHYDWADSYEVQEVVVDKWLTFEESCASRE